MSSVQSLPNSGTWTRPENSLPVLRGTDARERLNARPDEASVLVGGGGSDQLVGARGANTFKYEHFTDSTSNDPDTIFNFNPREDKVDLSDMVKNNKIKIIHIRPRAPAEVGDVQLKHSPFGWSTLDMKVNAQGPNFSIRIDNVKLLADHVKFFS